MIKVHQIDLKGFRGPSRWWRVTSGAFYGTTRGLASAMILANELKCRQRLKPYLYHAKVKLKPGTYTPPHIVEMTFMKTPNYAWRVGYKNSGLAVESNTTKTIYTLADAFNYAEYLISCIVDLSMLSPKLDSPQPISASSSSVR